jgi:2'-5' RNA ligase
MGESSIDILVPEAGPIISAWYGLTSAAMDGMPPHVTLLWPWRTSPLSEADIAAVQAAVSGIGPFRLSFRAFGRFPGALYLAPEPEEPVRRLMQQLARRFPDTPPYRGEFSSPVPHMTVAKAATDDELDSIEAAARSWLADRSPLRVEVREVCVNEEGIGSEGRWGVRARIAL